MARSGNFGRTPRAMPSLTNTLLAIAREQQNTEDSNLMSAWAKGGLFKGHKATDDFVLNYWRDRVKGVSKDDPLYDTYQNAVTQYEYTIAESKRTAAYAQIASPTAGDDSAMASFYMKWSKKIPKDSEFYRVLLRDAGQYIRSAAAKKKAVATVNTEEIYHKRMGAIEKRYETGGQKALDYLTRLAQEGAGGRGALLGQTVLGDYRDSMNQTNISQLDLADLDGLAALMDAVNDPSNEERRARGLPPLGNSAVLFYDAMDKPVTGQTIINALHTADPNFSGVFNLDSLRDLVVSQKEGLQKRIDLAKKTGHMSDFQSLTRDLERVDEYDEQIQATPVLTKYAKLNSDLNSLLQTTGMSPSAFTAEFDRIMSKIGALADDPSISTDGHLQSQLRGQAEGVAGTVTVADDMQGLQTSGMTGSVPANSVAIQQAIRETMVTNAELANQPGFAMTQGDYQSDGTFIPSAGGHEYGAASLQQINNMPNGNAGPAVTVMVSDGSGGMFPITVVPSPITATATMPDGSTLKPDSNKPAGAFIRYMADGLPVTLYRITDQATGVARWSPEAPVDMSLVDARDTDNGITWDFTDALAKVPPPEKLQNDMELVPGSGIYLRGFNNSTGKGGAWQIDGERAAWFTVPDRATAGFDRNTDAYSPTLAGALDLPDGPKLVAKYKDDPSFLSLIDADNRRAAGMTEQRDPSTGAVIGWAGGDANLYGQIADRSISAIQVATNGGVAANATGSPDERDQWDKLTTALHPAGAYVPPVTTSVLPSDALRGQNVDLAAYAVQRDIEMAALVHGFAPGTNSFQPSRFEKDDLVAGPTINTGIAIKAPNVQPWITPPTTQQTFGPTSGPTSLSQAGQVVNTSLASNSYLNSGSGLTATQQANIAKANRAGAY